MHLTDLELQTLRVVMVTALPLAGICAFLLAILWMQGPPPKGPF